MSSLEVLGNYRSYTIIGDSNMVDFSTIKNELPWYRKLFGLKRTITIVEIPSDTIVIVGFNLYMHPRLILSLEDNFRVTMDKAIQDKAIQDKAIQDKAIQDKESK